MIMENICQSMFTDVMEAARDEGTAAILFQFNPVTDDIILNGEVLYHRHEIDDNLHSPAETRRRVKPIVAKAIGKRA